MKKTAYRLLLLLVAFAMLPMMLVAHWRGYHDGVRAQTFATPATNADPDELDALLRELAANHWQGYADDALLFDNAALHNVFLTRKLSAHCLTISDYAVWRLQGAGYRARNVGLVNMQPETWEGTGVAHAILEVWHPRYAQWVVVDLLFNRLYAQTAVAFVAARSVPVMLADDPYSNPADFEEQLPEPETWEGGYPRLAQLLLIQGGNGGLMWYGDPAGVPVTAEFTRRYGGGDTLRYRDDFLQWAYGA
jgi:hypothetical protein